VFQVAEKLHASMMPLMYPNFRVKGLPDITLLAGRCSRPTKSRPGLQPGTAFALLPPLATWTHMPRTRPSPDEPKPPAAAPAAEPADEEVEGAEEEAAPENDLLCRLTGDRYKRTDEEEALQDLIDQLHREYRFELDDMERDVALSWTEWDEDKGKNRAVKRKVALVVYRPGGGRNLRDVRRFVMVTKKGTRIDDKKLGVAAVADPVLDAVNRAGGDAMDTFAAWTNTESLHFRYLGETPGGQLRAEDLGDFPGAEETLADLDNADRRQMRVATRASLYRTFRAVHDYLYGNQNMRGDRAFWQLLNLIFCKILDERESKRRFFVGATEGNTDEGRKRVVARIKALFEEVKHRAYKDVFGGNEEIELNDRALVYVAQELSRYSFLSTDTDAKGQAYETITSTTMKRERGQFFTPRNIIKMMVEMMDPRPGQLVLDPACGSGGFLVVVLNHVRNHIMMELGVDPIRPGGRQPGEPLQPIPVERRWPEVQRQVRKYAGTCLWGADVDPDLRKAARMNMVMNDDGHGNIFHINSLEFGVPDRETEEMAAFAAKVPGLARKWARRADGREFGAFDFIFTNPPFGAKIPVTDPKVLESYDLGRGQPKVPPEVLFIEACCKLLKPGGKLAIVLPDGILGNPGARMAFVRSWILREMRVLASVDLPAEAFLPQVSVQASCVFLERRGLDDDGTQGPVFMAIGEKVGHGRRGEDVWERGPDGREIIHEEEERIRWEDPHTHEAKERREKRKVRRIADDLPWIAEQYRRHVAGQTFEGE
jgi:type I restriction enzyme M protein